MLTNRNDYAIINSNIQHKKSSINEENERNYDHKFILNGFKRKPTSQQNEKVYSSFSITAKKKLFSC